MKLLFASSNAHKLREIEVLLPAGFTLIGLQDIQWTEDIPEPYPSLEENAAAKASYVFERTGIPCFAEDSGLFIDALDGRPGVLSARYAGEHGHSEANNEKVLAQLRQRESEIVRERDVESVRERESESVNDNSRAATFKAVIAYQRDFDHRFFFKGQVSGSISDVPRGHHGFGYDPIFIPSGFNQTFGELSTSLKSRISHRAKATQAFVKFLFDHPITPSPNH
ncbi:MAG TPA: non-canonical purine NTP pyrophosphatase [Saprospiraceae bacterium]|nr:non-canonical purine NTP pyrophosphatase [Saprospiraceae bacterium]